MQQRAKTFESLGWPTLIEELAARCHTARGAARARALPLFEHLAEAAARGAEIAEARLLTQLEQPLPFGGIQDVVVLVARAEKGGDLDGPELVAVGNTVAGVARLRRHLGEHAASAPRLA